MIEPFITSVIYGSHRDYTAGEVAEAVDLAGERMLVEGPRGAYIVGAPPDYVALGQMQVVMTKAGARWHARERAARNSRHERAEACRDAVLLGLYKQLDGADVEAVDVAGLGPFGYFYDDPFTRAEVNEAAKWLAKHGYLAGIPTADGTLISPKMEPRGSRIARSNKSVNDDPNAGTVNQTSNTMHVHGTVGSAQQGGASTTQNAITTQTWTAEGQQRVLGVADSLRAMRSGMGLDDDGDLVADDADSQLRAVVADPEPAQAAVRRALERARDVGALSAGTAIGSAFGVVVQGALQATGLA